MKNLTNEKIIELKKRGIYSEELIEKIDINEIQIKEKIEADVEKFSNLQKFFLGKV